MSPDVNDNGPSPGTAPGGPGGTRYEGQLRRELALLQQTYSETAHRCDGAMQEADYYKQKYKQASEEGERLQGLVESSELAVFCFPWEFETTRDSEASEVYIEGVLREDASAKL